MNSTTNDFEEWLESLGFNDSPPEQHTQAEQVTTADENTLSIPQDVQITAENTAVEVVDTPSIQSVSFSEEDVDSLLADNGFLEPAPEEEAEEIIEEEENEQEEEDTNNEHLYVTHGLLDQLVDFNLGEGRDIDIENNNISEELDVTGISVTASAEPMTIETPETPEEAADIRNTPLLPENSPTVSMDDSVSRFSGTEWFDEVSRKIIMIAGCGGIGSNVAYQIARLKPYSIVLYDDDIVETANMSGQLFRRKDIGDKKVQAVCNMLYNYTSMYNIRAIPFKFTPTTIPTDIMLCGFDSMEARKIYYKSWKKYLSNLGPERRKECLFMDGRLTIDVFQVFCITGEDTYNMERYEREFLFDDSQAESEVCSMKQTTYLACMIGSIMTNLFVNWVANSLDPIIPYKLPFFTQYEAQHMIFKTKE